MPRRRLAVPRRSPALPFGLCRDEDWWRERDSNPRCPVKNIHDFQSCSFDHSDTSPIGAYPYISIKFLITRDLLHHQVNQGLRFHQSRVASQPLHDQRCPRFQPQQLPLPRLVSFLFLHLHASWLLAQRS
jgi:hypothetical protein